MSKDWRKMTYRERLELYVQELSRENDELRKQLEEARRFVKGVQNEL